MTLLSPYWTTRGLSANLASNLWQELDRMSAEQQSYSPRADVVEAEDHYLMSLDLPGLKKEDLIIETQDKMLTISGERKRGTQVSFRRSFTLPDSVNGEKIQASYEDGVLELYLPKTPAAQPRKIEIQSEKGGFFEKFLGSKKSETENKNVSVQ